MRPGQNKRMRNNRPTNNRRGPNPLTRSYESNGPDVKIRGNAHHVAEKYLQLARDAHTGGDPVAAENYLQHAEHYFRLISSAQAAQALAQSGQPRQPGDAGGEEFDDDDDFGGLSDRFASPSERAGGFYQQQQPGLPAQPSAAPNAPQPYVERQPFEADRQGPKEQGGFSNRQDRQGNRFPDRGSRPDRPFAERPEGYRDNRQGRDGRPRDFRPYREGTPQPSREGPAEGVESTNLPSFITGGPRPGGAETGEIQSAPVEGAMATPAEAPESDLATQEQASPEGRFPSRGRRRRLRSPYGFNGSATAESDIDSPDPAIRDEPPIAE